MPASDDSAPTWCAHDAEYHEYHNVTVDQIAEFGLTVVWCPHHDPDPEPEPEPMCSGCCRPLSTIPEPTCPAAARHTTYLP
jgi:hypothetical protein